MFGAGVIAGFSPLLVRAVIFFAFPSPVGVLVL